jgi:GNAT superfamily N-acetyltransferase
MDAVPTATKESMLLDAFEVTIVGIDSIDPAQLQALSIGVGWPHRGEDWEFLCSVGQGIAAVDKIGRVVGSAMWFPYNERFATIGMVITTPRLQAQGAGRWLMENVLQQVDGRALGLNATAEALRLYVSLGFTINQAMYQRQGIAASPPDAALPAGVTLRAFGTGDLADIIALDKRAFDSDRSMLMKRLAEVSTGQVLEREGRIQAFSLCRAFGRGHVVGPIVARSDEDAIAVTSPYVVAHAGRFLRVDTRQRSGLFPQFLELSGMSVYDTLNTMWMGRPWPIAREDAPPEAPITYGLASHTLS